MIIKIIDMKDLRRADSQALIDAYRNGLLFFKIYEDFQKFLTLLFYDFSENKSIKRGVTGMASVESEASDQYSLKKLERLIKNRL